MNAQPSAEGRRRLRAPVVVFIVLLALAVAGFLVLGGRFVHTAIAPEPARQGLRDAGSEPGLTGQAAEQDHAARLRQGRGANQENYSVQNKVYEGGQTLERHREQGVAPPAPAPAPAAPAQQPSR